MPRRISNEKVLGKFKDGYDITTIVDFFGVARSKVEEIIRTELVNLTSEKKG